MAYLTKKKIKGKKYLYFVKSVKMPDGKVAKIMKILDNKKKKLSVKGLENKYKNYFIEKEAELNSKYVVRNFRTNYIFSEAEMQKLESIKINYRNLMRRLTKEQIKNIFDRFTVNFTYNSNAIEGNSLTLKDVRIVINENGSVKKDLREIYETRNSRRVVNLILSRRFDVSEKYIIKMHKMLMKDIDVRAGYKQLPNIIQSMGKEIETAKPENVKKEMDLLIKWYNDNKNEIHPLELAAMFHGKFEKIHPFEDGNGRVGRFLINIILIKNGYPPIIIRKSVRNAYMSALQAFDKNYEDKLKHFIVEKYKDTFEKFFEIYVKYV